MNDQPTRHEAICIDAAHPSLAGHFPGSPVVPGVLLLDRVIAAIEAKHGAGCAIRLPQIKFLRPLLPGEQARIVLDAPAPVPISGSNAVDERQYRIRFRIQRDDAVLASGEVVTVQTGNSTQMERLP